MGTRKHKLTFERAGILLVCLLVLGVSPLLGQKKPPDIPLGRILDTDSAQIVVRREHCRCEPVDGQADILFLTVGVETKEETGTRFQPVASYAFDQSIGKGDTGEWLGMWVYGPTGSGFFRHVAAWLPFPMGSPKASRKKLAKLERRLEQLQANDPKARRTAPSTYLNLTQVGRFPRAGGFISVLQRVLRWTDVYNPAQLVYRTYFSRRKDRGNRNFQRAQLALYWLMDAEFDSPQDREWLQTVFDIRFHVLRTRSLFGRFISAEAAGDMVLGYESTVRERLGKTSAWMQQAANEHYLRYEPIYRQTSSRRSLPVGGVLYYDPRLPPGDPGWWKVSNPFDLRINPHTHPAVQELAREHPDDLIPLAVYTFQTNLRLRPIIAIDFFSPGNPRVRENNQQLMSLLGNWLAIATGGLSLERIPYRAVTWAANKKGYTWFVNQSSSQGMEEMRLALETGLYFQPELRQQLLQRADKRVINPLIRSGPEERVRARLQYQSLRADNFKALCRQVGKIRRKMMERLAVSPALPLPERRREFALQLQSWRQLQRLRTVAGRAAGDYGSLEELREPLDYFLAAKLPLPRDLAKVSKHTYEELHMAELFLSGGHGLPELAALREQTLAVWRRAAESRGDKKFETQLAQAKNQAQEQFQKFQKKRAQHQAKQLRKLLKESRKELQRAARAGCDPSQSSRADLESFLALLRDVALVSRESEPLRAEIEKQRSGLEQILRQVDSSLAQCPRRNTGVYVAQRHAAGREMAQAVLDALNPRPAMAAGGGN